jgi:hypothetical protein
MPARGYAASAGTIGSNSHHSRPRAGKQPAVHCQSLFGGLTRIARAASRCGSLFSGFESDWGHHHR